MKIELPAKLTDKHHLLFQFYQISCQKPRPGEPLIQEPTFLGCTVSLFSSPLLLVVDHDVHFVCGAVDPNAKRREDTAW